MEVEGRQLIHDDGDRHILSLSAVHTGNETVQDKGVKCADDAFHFRVVGNEEIAGMFGVGHFQVKVIPVTMENPVRFLGGQP